MPSARAVPATIFDSLFNDPFFSAPLRPARPAARPGGATVQRSDDRVVVTLDLPGLRPEDVELTVTADPEGAVVAVSGERHDARGDRSVRWSARLRGVDADGVTGDLTDGVLTISAPASTAASPRQVELTSGTPAALDTVDASAVDAGDPATEAAPDA